LFDIDKGDDRDDEGEEEEVFILPPLRDKKVECRRRRLVALLAKGKTEIRFTSIATETLQ